MKMMWEIAIKAQTYRRKPSPHSTTCGYATDSRHAGTLRVSSISGLHAPGTLTKPVCFTVPLSMFSSTCIEYVTQLSSTTVHGAVFNCQRHARQKCKCRVMALGITEVRSVKYCRTNRTCTILTGLQALFEPSGPLFGRRCLYKTLNLPKNSTLALLGSDRAQNVPESVVNAHRIHLYKNPQFDQADGDDGEVPSSYGLYGRQDLLTEINVGRNCDAPTHVELRSGKNSMCMRIHPKQTCYLMATRAALIKDRFSCARETVAQAGGSSINVHYWQTRLLLWPTRSPTLVAFEYIYPVECFRYSGRRRYYKEPYALTSSRDSWKPNGVVRRVLMLTCGVRNAEVGMAIVAQAEEV
ncbi:hypothetical protein B0T20DRAFT_392938 [Sordaria brevicollis]|uniref:Uncharacterized protein n=1 Tax=Sordaria brevicollis TaxID=83679 RepID=A0AAE0UC04_SORBR|nr:hypothetical protein B0T20DRAFT_392938 [Sordaria brevicollis]